MCSTNLCFCSRQEEIQTLCLALEIICTLLEKARDQSLEHFWRLGLVDSLMARGGIDQDEVAKLLLEQQQQPQPEKTPSSTNTDTQQPTEAAPVPAQEVLAVDEVLPASATTSPAAPPPTTSAATEVTPDSSSASAADAVAPPPAPVATSERRATRHHHHSPPLSELEFEQELNNLMAAANDEMDEDAHHEHEEEDEEDEDEEDAEGDSTDTVEQEAEETSDDAEDLSHLQDFETALAATDSDGNLSSPLPTGTHRRLPRRTLFGWGPCEPGLPGWYFARSDSRLYAWDSYCILYACEAIVSSA